MFQFHKGTIRTPAFASEVEAVTSFNSIKVRLEHASNLVTSYHSFVSIP